MNGRTIRKRLMRNRSRVFWGDRAFLTVRFPLALIPEPLPSFTPPEGEELLRGQWVQTLGDGTEVVTCISELSSGSDPRTHGRDPIYFLESNARGVFHWWEGIRSTIRFVSGEWEDLSREPIPEDYVGTYRALRLWERAYLVGTDQEIGIPTLDALLDAGGWAKTTWARVDAERGHVYLTYSVDRRHPRWALDFSSVLRRAFRIAKAEGVPLKVLG